MRIIEHNRFSLQPASKRPSTLLFPPFPISVDSSTLCSGSATEGGEAGCRSVVGIFSFRPPLCSSVSLRLCGEYFPSGFWILNSAFSFFTPPTLPPRVGHRLSKSNFHFRLKTTPTYRHFSSNSARD